MSESDEPTTLGLSEGGHEILRRLKKDGYFAEMQDAYRFAIAFAARLYTDTAAVPDVNSPGTIFNVGTLDPDRRLWLFVNSVLGVMPGSIYKTAERLAEAGVTELGKRLQTGTLDLAKIMEELQP